jgi:hypothetical protein
LHKFAELLEKCESLEVKMGGMGRMGRWELGGGEYVPRLAVQRYEGN